MTSHPPASPRIHHVETLLPPHAYRQDYARDRMMEWLPDVRSRRLARGIYNRSGIETRYSVIPDFVPGATPVLFPHRPRGPLDEPSTGLRNQTFATWARDLSVRLARNALAAPHGFVPGDVTHVITVSCTGFYNPGPDYDIVRALDLPDSVQRYQLGFMGCYAALPALRMAHQFCVADPHAVVLVVCLELCTLHLQVSDAPDALLANALFADGTAAALVSARPPAPHRPSLELVAFQSALAPEGVGDMAWTIGDRGFSIRLSTYVPDVIAANIQALADQILAPTPWARDDIGIWAIHPGGRAILDKIEQELALDPAQIEDAREVLRLYGNMSSATLLFILRRLLERAEAPPAQPVAAMAFGPGLTIETALLRRHHALTPMPAHAAPASS